MIAPPSAHPGGRRTPLGGCLTAAPFCCGQDKGLIRLGEFVPSTDVHRITHRVRDSSAQTPRFGLLPNNGFRGNVNRPKGHGGAEIRGDPEIKRTGPAS